MRTMFGSEVGNIFYGVVGQNIKYIYRVEIWVRIILF